MSVDIGAFLDGVVHEPTQAGDGSVDLTLAAVHEVTGPGRVDFGGGELEAPETSVAETERRDSDDDYGWWNLERGRYLLEYNERLSAPPDVDFLLQPRTAVYEMGVSHPTLRIREQLPRVPLSVGDAGVRLKENARVSTLLLE